MAIFTRDLSKHIANSFINSITDNDGPYYLYGSSANGSSSSANGFFYPLYLTSESAGSNSQIHLFDEYPNTAFYMPATDLNQGVSTPPSNSAVSVYDDKDTLYAFIGKSNPWTDDESPDTETAAVLDEYYNVKKDMLYGKRLTRSDIAYVVDKKVWTSNTIYTQYDHRDSTLYDNDFYVINNNLDVYKCLFNNYDGYSNTEPSSKANTAFTTADGYIWKYMYSVSVANNEKFSTDTLMPIDANASVTAAASNGSIDVILIDRTGQDYKTANGTVQEVVNTTIFKLETDNINSNGYYTNSSFYIETGNSAGDIATITDYVSNSSGRYVTIDTALANVDITSTYLISPKINISGDGQNATAYCTVDANTGTIDSVNIINSGANYSFANVEVQANTSFGSNASLSAIMSPKGGHGFDPITELNCNQIMIEQTYSNSEINTVSTDIDFRQAGIIKAPLKNSDPTYEYNERIFDKTHRLTISTNPGYSFTENEEVYGLSSSANGIVAYSNSTYMILQNVYGDFANAETILGKTSSTTAIVTDINNPDIDKFSGDIIYYDNTLAVQRSTENKETIKLIITF